MFDVFHDAAHAGLAYRSTEEFLASAVPYLRRGVEAGEAVIAVTTARNLAALEGELGSAMRNIDVFEASAWYESQARALDRYLQYWGQRKESGWLPLRILGEPVGPQSDARDVERWTVFENGINDVMRAMPVRMLCAYDLTLPANSYENVELSHPHMAHRGRSRTSCGYVEPAAFAAERGSSPLPAPPADAFSAAFDRATLPHTRSLLDQFCARTGIDGIAKIDVQVAVGEAAANAVRYGGGAGMLRVWRASDELVAEVVSTAGRFPNVMDGYLAPPLLSERGRGLWIMRKICDWVDIRAHATGSTVRMYYRLERRGGST